MTTMSDQSEPGPLEENSRKYRRFGASIRGGRPSLGQALGIALVGALVASAILSVVYQTTPQPVNCTTCKLGDIDAGYGAVDALYDNASGSIFVLDSGPGAPGSAAWGVTVINGTSESVARFLHISGRPGYSFAYDPRNGNLYATSECDDGIYVINAASGANVSWIATPSTPICEGPQSIAYDPVSGYVVALDPPTVLVIDPSNNTLVRTADLGVEPFLLGVNSVTGQVYVATSAEQVFAFNLTVLYGSNFTVESSLQLTGIMPAEIFDPLNDRVYVASSLPPLGTEDAYNGTLTVLNGNGTHVLASERVGDFPYAAAVDDSNQNLYITNYYSSNISIVNGTTNLPAGSLPVGSNPSSIVYDGRNRCLYALFYSSSSEDQGDGYLTVIAPPGSDCATPPNPGIWTAPAILVGLAVLLALLLTWGARRTRMRYEQPR
jgi:DNA-binding beta-propeller fold protein YncE